MYVLGIFVYNPELGTWKIYFCRAVITQDGDPFFFYYKVCNCKQTVYELSLSTLIYQMLR